MQHMMFLNDRMDLASALPTYYNWRLVTFSVMISVLAAYAALGGAGRVRAAETMLGKTSWLAIGAVTMGVGVWAMHFLGMLAFMLPVKVGYNIPITALSMVPAIIASGYALHILGREQIGVRPLIGGGVVVGAGIGLMHYTGMAAMRMDAVMFYDLSIFALSILVAIGLSIIALYVKFRATRNGSSLTHSSNLLAAIVMGLAVAGMHYVGMAAVYFFPGNGFYHEEVTLDPMWLGAWVSLAIFLIIGLALVVMKYSENIEGIVAERTKQLALANSQVTVLNAQLHSENIRMGSELDVTRRLQLMLLPAEEELASVAGLDIACFMRPAAEVGGDYYDVLEYEGRIKIGIGDVTGHGLESGVVMVMTQAIVRALMMSGETDPVHFLSVINDALHGNVKRMGVDKNLTLCLLDYDAGEMKVSGQHEEVIIVRHNATVERINTMDLGFPVGLVGEIDKFINQVTINLEPGDGVVLYTDGITEAENMAQEQYGIDRLCEVLRVHWLQSAQQINEAVIADVTRYIGEQTLFDDITLVVAKQI